MPIFEYKCETCSAVFSVLTRYENRDDKQVCPNCNSRRNHPVMSATPTTFKFADRSARKSRRLKEETDAGDETDWS